MALPRTGGTIDKLESIKGYQVERSQEDFIRQVQDIGVSVKQSDQLAKADKLYALRDVTATVDTIPFDCCLVMQQENCCRSDAILLDVTVGEGTMKTVDEARNWPQTMVDLGKAVGQRR